MCFSRCAYPREKRIIFFLRLRAQTLRGYLDIKKAPGISRRFSMPCLFAPAEQRSRQVHALVPQVAELGRFPEQ